MNLPDPDIVEPLPVDGAWNRGDHSVRKMLQLRPMDESITMALMQGTGAREAAFRLHVYQKGLKVLVEEKMHE